MLEKKSLEKAYCLGDKQGSLLDRDKISFHKLDVFEIILLRFSTLFQSHKKFITQLRVLMISVVMDNIHAFFSLISILVQEIHDFLGKTLLLKIIIMLSRSSRD